MNTENQWKDEKSNPCPLQKKVIVRTNGGHFFISMKAMRGKNSITWGLNGNYVGLDTISHWIEIPEFK